MRIAFFCPTVSGMGGVETATLNLMAGFRALGDEAHLFLFGGSFDREWLKSVDHTIIGSPEDARLLRMAQYAIGSVQAVRGWRPDAIICSDVTTIQMARVGRRLSGRHPVIASWIHYPLDEVRFKEKLHLADLHLAISAHIGENLRAYLPDAPVATIFNGVDISRAEIIPRPLTASFLYVGRLTCGDQKRVDDLLRAVARLQGDWKLRIIGGVPKGEEYHGERLAAVRAELGIDDRVEWMGWQRNAWEACGPATALVMPSDREGFPMVLIEAIAHGVICISSDCKSGPSEIIEEGTNGWLFPVGDIEKLAGLLQRIVDAPLDLPLQEAVRATAERFSISATAQRARGPIVELIAEKTVA